jgi:transcriptional regulator with XRE-family HTH domain
MQNNAISHKLLALRRSLDLTQAEFAQATGFSLRAISAWETGERIPKNRNMEEIERFVAQTLSSTTKDVGVEPKIVFTNTELMEAEENMYRNKYEQLLEKYLLLQEKMLEMSGSNFQKKQTSQKKKQA